MKHPIVRTTRILLETVGLIGLAAWFQPHYLPWPLILFSALGLVTFWILLFRVLSAYTHPDGKKHRVRTSWGQLARGSGNVDEIRERPGSRFANLARRSRGSGGDRTADPAPPEAKRRFVRFDEGEPVFKWELPGEA